MPEHREPQQNCREDPKERPKSNERVLRANRLMFRFFDGERLVLFCRAAVVMHV